MSDTNRIKTTISAVSKILVDENGFEYVNLILGDGVEGFYPGKADTLSAFKPGVRISYSGYKKFNGMSKIIGIMIENEETADTIKICRITAITDIFLVKGWYTRTVGLDNGVSANIVAKQPSALSQYRIGNLVSYSSVKETDGFGLFFSDIKKEFEYSGEDRRQLSIMRQSCLKVATELYLAANSKTLAKSSWDDVVNDLIKITDRLVGYVNVD